MNSVSGQSTTIGNINTAIGNANTTLGTINTNVNNANTTLGAINTNVDANKTSLTALSENAVDFSKTSMILFVTYGDIIIGKPTSTYATFGDRWFVNMSGASQILNVSLSPSKMEQTLLKVAQTVINKNVVVLHSDIKAHKHHNSELLAEGFKLYRNPKQSQYDAAKRFYVAGTVTSAVLQSFINHVGIIREYKQYENSDNLTYAQLQAGKWYKIPSGGSNAQIDFSGYALVAGLAAD